MSTAKKISYIAIFTALALVISVAENFIPIALIPLPGVKLGLANIVTLFVLCFLGFKDALCVLILRCILAGMFSGNITSFFFSMVGGVCALCIMYFLLKTNKLSLAGVSIAGAALHGIGQIFVACIMLGTISAIFYLPFLLFCALFTGAITGTVSHFLFMHIKKINV